MRKPTGVEVTLGTSLLLSFCGLALAGRLLLGEGQKTADALTTSQALAGAVIQLTAEIAADPAATDTLIAATSTLAATNTLEPTFTPLPPPSATPFPIDKFISRRPDGSLIRIDWRDAWGSLPNSDTDGNDKIEDPELAPAATQLNLWTDDLRQAYTTGVLGDQTVTTYEKLAEAHGFVAENFNLDFNWHPVDEYGSFADELNSYGSLGIATTADRLSETMVHLSEELAELGRQKNPDGQVRTPDQIYWGITANLNLEGKWMPGIDPEEVDEIRRQCFTFRREEGYERPDQSEVIEPAVWEEELRPGVEIKLGQEWVDAAGVGHFSNDGLIGVVITVVSVDQLDNIKDVLSQQNHQAAFTEIVPGWWAVTMEFDMSERSHSPEDAVAADQLRGSGGQLIECGPEIPTAPAPAPEISRTPVVVLTPTPGPTGTPRPGDTPTPPVGPTQPTQPPPETPRPTDAPTQPPPPPTEVPRSTDAPTQPPQATATAGNPVETPNPPTPEPTSAPAETQAGPEPTTIPVAETSTPSR